MKASAETILKQAGLTYYGFNPGPIDGIPGPRTEAAFAAWQASRSTNGPAYGHLQLQELRWKSAEVEASRAVEVGRICDRIWSHRGSYQKVGTAAGVPWYVVACLHNMESGGDFLRHLHEGSPLTGRTRYEPKGRPVAGHPPFLWEVSAVDALEYDKMGTVNWQRLGAMLYAIERYNGLGYLRYHKDTPSPYLWGSTSLETPGKYIGDGQWSATARTQQVGVAAILKVLESRGVIEMPGC